MRPMVQRMGLTGAPNDASGMAGWIGFHNASSCSGVRRVRDAITLPPNAAVFTAAQPALPTTRIGTVTPAASAAASSDGLELPSTVAFDSALDASSSTSHARASTVHWLAASRPPPVPEAENH